MNFLAHIYLSGNNPKLMIGNFIGDFVKGRNLQDYEPDIARGIELHRAIDAYTDNHPVVAKSKDRLRPNYRHYASVIVDMYYDHLLARNWDRYHKQPLNEFARQTYATVEDFESILPPRFSYMFSHMTKGNWLLNYSKLEGLQRALTGMAGRSKYNSKMELAVNDLTANYDHFSAEFAEFFPELKQYSDNWIAENILSG